MILERRKTILKDMRCLIGIHDWKYKTTSIRSCGSELEKHYRCSRCGDTLYMECDSTSSGCEYFKFPRCIYVTNSNPECYKMRKKK